MIASWPGQIAPGTKTDVVGHLVDFLPTMLAMAGADAPGYLPGESLLPVLRGGETPRANPLFWNFKGYEAIREGDWKLITNGKKGFELYDLASDPTELHDLAANEPDTVARLRAAWEIWWADKGFLKPR
jgi:arylsulfatase